MNWEFLVKFGYFQVWEGTIYGYTMALACVTEWIKVCFCSRRWGSWKGEYGEASEER